MPRELKEGEDFYFEGPYMVFTEKFLRDRGYCCESGCRHCPYGFKRDGRGDVAGEGEREK
ncbi:MAG: DUF5522 domain-containing protein [Thermoanaerobaculia bacterium]